MECRHVQYKWYGLAILASKPASRNGIFSFPIMNKYLAVLKSALYIVSEAALHYVHLRQRKFYYSSLSVNEIIITFHRVYKFTITLTAGNNQNTVNLRLSVCKEKNKLAN